MNEADTRAELIEPQLRAAGWDKSKDSEARIAREYRITDGEILPDGRRGKALKADFALIYKNVKLAIVEAKSVNKEAREGVAQAELYSRKLGVDTAFATNGKDIYQICRKTNTRGAVAAYPSPRELWEKSCGAASALERELNSTPFATVGAKRAPRYYQELATDAALRALAAGRKRVLLTMATGTGKTFVAFQIAWKLYQARWNLSAPGARRPRFLFLTDRNILADQAMQEFREFGDDALVRVRPELIKKRGDVPTNGSVFFTIYQTFLSGTAKDDDGEEGVATSPFGLKGAESAKYYEAYPSDFFDLVIVDECHRGGANDESKWRRVLDHFSAAAHLGLTATPRRKANADTYNYFGEPVFSYSLRDGVRDGFLTPFRVKRFTSNIDEYWYQRGDIVKEGSVAEDYVYEEADINRKVEIPDRERHRVQQMLRHINPDEKTLVFCGTQRHAALVRDLINEESAGAPSDYCARVTADDGEIGEAHLRQFRDNEKTLPTILTTSRKLSTGVDARNVRNIVLLRRVDDMIEFKQIIGRGTRLYEGKLYFTILDFVKAYLKFGDSDWDGAAADEDEINIDVVTEIEPPADLRKRGRKRRDSDADAAPPKMIKIELSDGRARSLRSVSTEMFYLNGKPVSVENFIRYMYDDLNLPELLGDLESLRDAWSDPERRGAIVRRLKRAMEETGCKFAELDKLLPADGDLDLYDLLAHIAFNAPQVSRSERVAAALRRLAERNLGAPWNELADYALNNYKSRGASELNRDKLSGILKGKYGSIEDARRKLGSYADIKAFFAAIQRDLYAPPV